MSTLTFSVKFISTCNGQKGTKRSFLDKIGQNGHFWTNQDKKGSLGNFGYVWDTTS
jgi:hypothetical protein